MLSFINLPARVIGLLESNVSPREIAAGVCLGLFLGFTPFNGPMALLFVLFFFIFKLNRVSTLLTLPLFKAAYLFGVSGLIEKLGGYILIDAKFLTGFWAFVTGLPLIAYLDLNNTLVAGGFTASLILSVPLYFISRYIAAKLKNIYGEKVKKTRAAKAASGIKMADRINSALYIRSGLSLNIKGIAQMLFGSIKSRLFGRKAPAKGVRKRVNIAAVVILIISLVIIQYGIGLAVSPVAGSFIIESVNRVAGTKISAGSINIWPLTLSFSIKDLKVFNPEDTGERLLKADSSSFRLSPLALLSKRIAFSSINLSGAEIDLEGKPDGSFNIQSFTSHKKAAPEEVSVIYKIKSMWEFAKGKKDLLGKFYEFVKKRFSKEAKEKRKIQMREQRALKTVTELPKGRRVRFHRGAGAYIFRIGDLNIDNGYLKLSYEGDQIQIKRARIRLGDLALDPQLGTKLGLFSLAGDVSKNDILAGGINILFSQKENDARFNAYLKNIDLDTVRFVYQDSIPVSVLNGRLTLSSRNSIRSGAIDSRTDLYLTGHRLEAKNPVQTAFGIVPVSAIAEALNSIDPVRLKFSIGGTVDRPELGGFQESLMALVKPYLANIKDRAVKEAASAISRFFKNKSDQ